MAAEDLRGIVNAQHELLLALYARWAIAEGLSRPTKVISRAIDRIKPSEHERGDSGAALRADHGAKYLQWFDGELRKAARD